MRCSKPEGALLEWLPEPGGAILFRSLHWAPAPVEAMAQGACRCAGRSIFGAVPQKSAFYSARRSAGHSLMVRNSVRFTCSRSMS